MNPLRDRHAPILLSILSCAGITGFLGHPACVHAQDARALLNPLAAFGRTKLNKFVEAPLFEPARHLPPPPAAVVYTPPQTQAPLKPPPSIHLLGVISGKTLVAIIGGSAGKTEMLRTGDEVEGWKVEVLPLGLRLRDGLRTSEYGLFKPSSSTAPVTIDSPANVASVFDHP